MLDFGGCDGDGDMVRSPQVRAEFAQRVGDLLSHSTSKDIGAFSSPAHPRLHQEVLAANSREEVDHS